MDPASSPRLQSPAGASATHRPEASATQDGLEQASTNWLLLAHILRPQGRKGEVLAELFTDFPQRFESLPRVYLATSGFAGTPDQALTASVVGFFLPVGKNSGRIVLELEGITSISAAESLAGLDVLVPYEERLEPEEDASYISDLLGCVVYDLQPGADPLLVGTVDDIHFPTIPDGSRRLDDAAPLLSVLSPTGAEILIPYVKIYLIHLDLDARRIDMQLPSGLIEVNA